MSERIKSKTFKWLYNFDFLKIPLGILICKLIFDEIMLFAIEKPTSSSFSETDMVPELNPLIIICKTPAYDEKYLKYFFYFLVYD